MRWPLIALGAGAYLAFLIATFPAGAAYRWFVPESVVLAAPEGTLWRGGASGGSAGGLSATEIHWRIRPWALLAGRVGGALELRLTDGFVSTGFSIRPSGRIALNDARLSTSIETLGTIVPVYDTRGQVSAELETLVIEDDWPITAIGQVRLGDLQVAPLLASEPGQRMALGNFLADLTTDDDGKILAMVSDLSGPLEVDGLLTLDSDRNYILDARVRLRPDAPQLLRDGLALMAGEPDADGFRQLSLSGGL